MAGKKDSAPGTDAGQHAPELTEKTAQRHGAKFSILEDWKILRLTDANGTLSLCLEGIVFGALHPVCGDYARTSALARYRLENNRLVIITRSGSEYMLGMRQAPQAEDRKRLIRYLDRIASARGAWQSTADVQTDILDLSKRGNTRMGTAKD